MLHSISIEGSYSLIGVEEIDRDKKLQYNAKCYYRGMNKTPRKVRRDPRWGNVIFSEDFGEKMVCMLSGSCPPKGPGNCLWAWEA